MDPQRQKTKQNQARKTPMAWRVQEECWGLLSCMAEGLPLLDLAAYNVV